MNDAIKVRFNGFWQPLFTGLQIDDHFQVACAALHEAFCQIGDREGKPVGEHGRTQAGDDLAQAAFEFFVGIVKTKREGILVEAVMKERQLV